MSWLVWMSRLSSGKEAIMSEPNLKSWTDFQKKCLNDKGILFVDGEKPDKIFQVSKFAGAKKAMTVLTRTKVTDWIIFSVDGFSREFMLMATAMLLKDLQSQTDKPIKIYIEDHLAYLEGRMPSISSVFDKEGWGKFIREIK